MRFSYLIIIIFLAGLIFGLCACPDDQIFSITYEDGNELSQQHQSFNVGEDILFSDILVEIQYKIHNISALTFKVVSHQLERENVYFKMDYIEQNIIRHIRLLICEIQI